MSRLDLFGHDSKPKAKKRSKKKARKGVTVKSEGTTTTMRKDPFTRAYPTSGPGDLGN